MNKKIKFTSGILAGALLFSNFSGGVDITKAQETPFITVQNANDNVSAQITREGQKNYLVLKALNDTKNLSIKVKVSNGQMLTFKQEVLLKGELAKFELKIKEPVLVEEKGKSLPKTKLVREELVVKGVVKSFNVEATVKYDVEKKFVETKIVVSSNEITDLIENKKDENKVEKVEKEDVAKPAEENTESVPASNTAPVAETTPAPATPQPSTSNTTFRKAVNTPVVPVIVNNSNFHTKIEAEIFAELNKHRIANGKKPLVLDNSLLNGAGVRVNEFYELFKQGKTGMDLHKRLDGSSFRTAFSGVSVSSENVATSPRGTVGLMGFWKKSTGHNEAMLDSSFTRVAIRVIQKDGWYYAVQNFGK